MSWPDCLPGTLVGDADKVLHKEKDNGQNNIVYYDIINQQFIDCTSDKNLVEKVEPIINKTIN